MLIELLVVVAIIAILAAMLFFVLLQARERARMSVCISNLKQLGLAILMYADSYDGYLPDSRHPTSPTGYGGGLHYCDAGDYYVDRFWTGQLRQFINLKRNIFRCPSAVINASKPPNVYGDISYAYNGVLAYTDDSVTGGYGPGIQPWGTKKLDRAEKPSETIAISESVYGRSFRAWLFPLRGGGKITSVGRVHNNGSSGNYLMLDGSVSTIFSKNLTCYLFKFDKSVPDF
jgi:prepilin-type processing-associated H-X9-DG protein